RASPFSQPRCMRLPRTSPALAPFEWMTPFLLGEGPAAMRTRAAGSAGRPMYGRSFSAAKTSAPPLPVDPWERSHHECEKNGAIPSLDLRKSLASLLFVKPFAFLKTAIALSVLA